MKTPSIMSMFHKKSPTTLPPETSKPDQTGNKAAQETPPATPQASDVHASEQAKKGSKRFWLNRKKTKHDEPPKVLEPLTPVKEARTEKPKDGQHDTQENAWPVSPYRPASTSPNLGTIQEEEETASKEEDKDADPGKKQGKRGWFGMGKKKKKEPKPIAPLGLAHDAVFQGLIKQIKPGPTVSDTKPPPQAAHTDVEIKIEEVITLEDELEVNAGTDTHTDTETLSHSDSSRDPADQQLIDPKTKEIRPALLGALSAQLTAFLASASESLGPHAARELQSELGKLAALGTESATIAAKLSQMRVPEDRLFAEKMAARFLGESVRDCYAKASGVCEKYLAKADNGSELQSNLAALAGLFTELKRHHLTASATPAFEAYATMETHKMNAANPGMVANRSGAAISNAKAVSVDVGAGLDGTSPIKLSAEGGLEFEAAEELSVDDDGDQNRWDKRSLTFKVSALFDGGLVGGRLSGRMKVSMGANYAEAGSFPEQTKVYGRQKADESYLNRASESAGPNARNWKNGIRSANKLPKMLTLGDFTSAALPVHLTETKVAKGAQNTSVIQAMANKVAPELAAIMQEAYLPLERPMEYGATSAPAGGAGQRGKDKTTITTVEGQIDGAIKVPIADIGKGYLPVAAELKGAIIGRRREFDVERLKPSHALLTIAHTKDMRKSLDLWKAIETTSQSDARLGSKLAQYDIVKQKIAAVTSGDDRTLPYDAALFGPVTDIPDAFLKTILTPEETFASLAAAIAEQCDRLGANYETFQRNAGPFSAVAEKHAPAAVKAHYATLHGEAYEAITNSSWKPAAGGAGHLKELISSNTKRSEFLADGYDALSTALASAGTHLEILKMRVGAMENPPLALARQIMVANASYAKANAALMQGDLPLHEDTLHRYSTVAWAALSSKNELEIQGTLTVGGDPTVVSTPLGEEIPSDSATVSLDTGLAGVTATLAWKNVTAAHPNLTRAGEFREWSLSLGGGAALGGAAIERIVLKAIKAMRADGGAEITPSERDALRDILKTAASAGALDNATNTILSWKYHKFSKAGDNAYRQMYFRISEQDRTTFAPSVSIPVDPTMISNVKAGVRTTQDIKLPIFEMMGPDLSHHILSLVRMDELRTKAKNKFIENSISAVVSSAGTSTGKLAEAAEKAAAESKLSIEEAEALKKDVLFEENAVTKSFHRTLTMGGPMLDHGGEVLTEMALAEKKKRAAGLEKLDAAIGNHQRADEQDLLRHEFDLEPYRKNQFFSSDAIFDVVKDYRAFLDWKENPAKVKQPENGFVFYEREEVQDVVRNAREVESKAAGKTSFTINEDSGTVTVEHRPSLSDPIDVPKEQLQEFEQLTQELIAAKRRSGKEARLTPDDRADLLLTTPEGKAIFQLYTKIVSTYKELNATASTLLGYDGRLREDEPDWQRTQRAAGAGKNAAAALKDIMKSTGLRASPGAGDAATKVLAQRDYFAGAPKHHDELFYDEHSVQQTDSWLARHGLAKAENKLSGIHSLVVAHLQHATGDYSSLHVTEAAAYMRQLESNEPSEEAMQGIVAAINRRHGAVQARLIAPNDENAGAPVWTGDLGTSPQKDARSVVIMRSLNNEGDVEFAAVVQLKAPNARDIPEHLRKLDDAVAIREKIVGAPQQRATHDSGLTGTELRAAMEKLGVEKRGTVKTLTAKAADQKRPERDALRNLDDTSLRKHAHTAARLLVGSAAPWREAVKEIKKRDDMRDALTGAATGRPVEKKTGKELRQESNDGQTPSAWFKGGARQIASQFQRGDKKTAEVMTRLNLHELNFEVENALNPKIKAAAVAELKKRAALSPAVEVSAEEEEPVVKSNRIYASGFRAEQQLESETYAYFGQHTDSANAWFAANDYTVMRNSGNQNNCLILSLLQHAGGQQTYDSAQSQVLEAKAEEIRIKLGWESNDMLFARQGSGDETLERVVDLIRQESAAQFPLAATLNPIIVSPSEHHITATGYIDDDEAPAAPELGDHQVIVLGRNGARHYEAVMKTTAVATEIKVPHLSLSELLMEDADDVEDIVLRVATEMAQKRAATQADAVEKS